MTTKTKTRDLETEEREMDAEIERLEAEQRELDSPARALRWEDVRAGTEDLEGRERRRGILPRLITAAKVRRLQLRGERYEGEAEPFRKLREEAHERLQAATAKRLEAVEAENRARYEYSDANLRAEGREARIKETDREIRALEGGGVAVADKEREASRAFSEVLREKVAASRIGLRLEDLMGTGAEQRTAPGGRNEDREDEEGER